MTSKRTPLAALIDKFRGCNVHGDAEEPPVAILWTDPKIGEIQGQSLPDGFAPAFRFGRPTTAAELRKALNAVGTTVLADDELNLPSSSEARGWLETGDLEGAGALAVLISPGGRVVAQRRSVVGGEA